MTNSNTQSIYTFPEYAEWVDSPQWREHLFNHQGRNFLGCAGCAVRPMLSDIHEAVFNGTFAQACWELQDGYGVIGGFPGQHFDWSGIRDSSPAAIDRMHSVINGVELIDLAS